MDGSDYPRLLRHHLNLRAHVTCYHLCRAPSSLLGMAAFRFQLKMRNVVMAQIGDLLQHSFLATDFVERFREGY